MNATLQDHSNPPAWNRRRRIRCYQHCNCKPPVSKDSPIARGKPLSSEADRLLIWEVHLAKDVYPFTHDILEMGIGFPNSLGRADKEKDNHIHEHEILEYTLRKLKRYGIFYIDDIHIPSGFSSDFQVDYWTSYRKVIFRHGQDKTVIRGIKGVKEGLHPIAVMRTKFGCIDLIPSTEPPTMEERCAQEIVKNISKIDDIDELIVGSAHRMLLKREWLRMKAINVDYYQISR